MKDVLQKSAENYEPRGRLDPVGFERHVRFLTYVGIGLKWLLQRHKLLAAAQHIRASDQPNWAALAYDLGYSSQQHFITDFK